jgi:hypothetical protein
MAHVSCQCAINALLQINYRQRLIFVIVCKDLFAKALWAWLCVKYCRMCSETWTDANNCSKFKQWEMLKPCNMWRKQFKEIWESYVLLYFKTSPLVLEELILFLDRNWLFLQNLSVLDEGRPSFADLKNVWINDEALFIWRESLINTGLKLGELKIPNIRKDVTLHHHLCAFCTPCIVDSVLLETVNCELYMPHPIENFTFCKEQIMI